MRRSIGLFLFLAALPARAAAPADPFQWLEDGASAKTRDWTGKQDAATRKLLNERPERAPAAKRLGELLKVGDLGSPAVRPGRVFFTKRTGLQNQPVLYFQDQGETAPHALIDPNVIDSSGAVSLDWWHPSLDGQYLAYGLSEKGSEDSVLRVREVGGLDLPDRIERARHASVAWLPDRTGFYYTRYPRPGTVPAGEEQFHRKVYFHRLGTDPVRDPLVFGEGRAKEDWPDISVSDDGRWLIATVFQGWSRSELYIKELASPATAFMPVAVGKDAVFSAVADGDTLYILTNLNAPRYKIVAADLRRLDRPWRRVVEEGAWTITGMDLAGKRLAVSVLERATSRLRLHDLAGKALSEIPIPRLGSVEGFDGCRACGDLVVSYESFFVPPTLYRWRIDRSSLTVIDAVKVPADLSGYESEQVSYPSKDGTTVTMFLVHRANLKRDRRNPTLLSGYGGFSVNMTPSFSPSLLLWLEKGGLYALPNLRGGGEYGEDWHKAGMLENKQNVFDDFIAAGRWLVEQEYTSPERLAISGGSNGGLLMGAALTQAPELFRAVVCSVPLLDMLSYHKFLLARLWIPEYGSAEDPKQAAYLARYSPYHNVKAGARYPAVLFVSGETDSRVDPMHARKMAARLQAESPGSTVLLRYEKAAGHGAGKPLSKTIEELADRYAFLFWQLEMR